MGTLVALGGFLVGSFLGGSAATALGATAAVAYATSMVTGTLLATFLGGAVSTQNPPSEIESERKFQDLKYPNFQQNATLPIAHGVVYLSGTAIMLGKNSADLRQVGERTYKVQTGKDDYETKSSAIKQPFYTLDALISLCEGPVEEIITLEFQDFDVTHLEGDVSTGWILFPGDADEDIEANYPNFWARMKAVTEDPIPFRNTAKIGWYGDIGTANSIPRITAVLKARRGTYDTTAQSISHSYDLNDSWMYYDPDLQELVCPLEDQSAVASFDRTGGDTTITTPPGGASVLFAVSWSWKDTFVIYEDSAELSIFVGRKGYGASSSWSTKDPELSVFDEELYGYCFDMHHGIIYTIHYDGIKLYLLSYNIEEDSFGNTTVTSFLSEFDFPIGYDFDSSYFVGMYYDHENDDIYFAFWYSPTLGGTSIALFKVDVDTADYSYTFSYYDITGLKSGAPKGLLKTGDVFVTLDTSPLVSSAVAGDSLVFEVDFTSTDLTYGKSLPMANGWYSYVFGGDTGNSEYFSMAQDSSDILYSSTAIGKAGGSYVSIFNIQDSSIANDIESFDTWDDLLEVNEEWALTSIVRIIEEDSSLWIKTNFEGRDGWQKYDFDSFNAAPYASDDQKVISIVSIEPPVDGDSVSVGSLLRAKYGDNPEYYYCMVTRQGSETSGGLLFEVGYYYAGAQVTIAETTADDYEYNTSYVPRQALMFKVTNEGTDTDRLKLWYGTKDEDDDPIINTTITGSVVTALRVVTGPNDVPNAYSGILSKSIKYSETGSDEDLYSYGRTFSISFYNVDMEIPAHYVMDRFSLLSDTQPSPRTSPVLIGDPRLLDDTIAGRYWRQSALYGAKRSWHNRSTYDVVCLTAPTAMFADPWTGYMFIRDTVDGEWVYVYTRWHNEDWSYISKTEYRQRIFTSLHSGPGWIFDIMTNNVFGMGMQIDDPSVAINIASFEESEGYALEQVFVNGDDGESYFEDRYHTDGMIDGRSSGSGHCQKIASNFNAFLIETNGEVRLVQLRPMRRVERLFDKASIKWDGDESTISGTKDDVFNRPNEIVTEYRNEDEDYRFFPEREFDEYAQEHFGIPSFPFRNIRNVVREYVNRRTQNVRMNRYDLNAVSMLDERVMFVTDMRACDLVVGSYITTTYASLAYSNRLMQVTSIRELADSNGGVEYQLESAPFTNDLFNVADTAYVPSKRDPKVIEPGDVVPPGIFLCGRDLYGDNYMFAYGFSVGWGSLTAVSLHKKTGTVDSNTKRGYTFEPTSTSYLTPCGLVRSVLVEEEDTKTLVLLNPNGELPSLNGIIIIRKWFKNQDTNMIEYALSPVEFGKIDEVSLVNPSQYTSPILQLNNLQIEGVEQPALAFIRNVRDPSRGSYYKGIRFVSEGPFALTVANYLTQGHELYRGRTVDESLRWAEDQQFSVAYARRSSGWQTIAYRWYDSSSASQFEDTSGAAWFDASDPWEIAIVSDKPFNYIEILPNLTTYGADVDNALSGEPIEMVIDKMYFWDGYQEKWQRIWNIVDGTSGMRYSYNDGEDHLGSGISFALPYWPVRPFYSDAVLDGTNGLVMYYRLEEEMEDNGSTRFASMTVPTASSRRESAYDNVGVTSLISGGLSYYHQPFRSTTSKLGWVPFLNNGRHIDLGAYDDLHAGGGWGTYALPIYTSAAGRCPLGAAKRTVECWFRVDADSSVEYHGLWGYGGINQDLSETFISSNGKYFCCYYQKSTLAVTVDCGHSSGLEDWSITTTDNSHFNQNGSWNHLVVTAVGSTINIYVNGFIAGTGNVDGNLSTSLSTKTYEGNNFGVGDVGSKFIMGATTPINDYRVDTELAQPDMFAATYSQYVLDGAIDEVAVYSSILDDSTIKDHYLIGSGIYLDGGGPWGRMSAADFVFAAHELSASPLDTAYDSRSALNASGLTGSYANLSNRESCIYTDGTWVHFEPDYDDAVDDYQWPTYERPDGVEDWGAFVVRILLKKPATIPDGSVYQNGFIRTSLMSEFVVFNELNITEIGKNQVIPFEGESFGCQSHGSGGKTLSDFSLAPKYYVPYTGSVLDGTTRNYFQARSNIDAFVAVGVDTDGWLVPANGDYDSFVPAIGILLRPVLANRWNATLIAHTGEVIENTDWDWVIDEDGQGFVPIYLDTNISGYDGGSQNLTQTRPTGVLVQQVGVAVTPTTISVKIEYGYSHGHVYEEELQGTIDGVNTEFTTAHPFLPQSVRVYWAVNDSGGLRVVEEIDSYGFVEYGSTTIIMQSPPFIGTNDYNEYESQKLYVDYEVDYSSGNI